MKSFLTGTQPDKLGAPKPGRFYIQQEFDCMRIALNNRKESFCKLQRIGVDILIRVTGLNGGQIPSLEQILVKRARNDATRSRRHRR